MIVRYICSGISGSHGWLVVGYGF